MRLPLVVAGLGGLGALGLVLMLNHGQALPSVELPEGFEALPERERIVALARLAQAEWIGLTPAQRIGRIRSFWEQAIGTSTLPANWETLWSAAFVVAVVNAAAPRSLPRVGRHLAYVQASARGETRYLANDAAATFVIEPGDLVLKPRPGGTETFADIARPEGFDAHVDIVTEVYPDRVVTIGGNKVGGGVGQETYVRNPSGALEAPAIAVLRFKEGDSNA